MSPRNIERAAIAAAVALGAGVLTALVSAYRIGLACLARGPM